MAKKVTKKNKRVKTVIDLSDVYAPKSGKVSSIKDELLKVTSVKSKEQKKKPRKLVFNIFCYVGFALLIIAFCIINFGKIENEILYKETSFDVDTTNTYISKVEPIEIEDEILYIDDVYKETEKKQVKETVKSKTNEKSREITSKIDNTKDNSLNNLLSKYDTELYSSATYYQYNIDDVKDAFAKLTSLYRDVEHKVWGDVSFDDKGIYGKLYLNFDYMKEFIENITNLDRSRYASLTEVETCELPVTFDFSNAKDMGIYYEVPANDGKNKLKLMVLKGARVGFSQNFSLMTMLEILDLEWGTRHNPYFTIENVVGSSPKAKSMLTETSFKIDEMLKTAKFSNIRYDKKGYITDLFFMQ